MADKAKEADEMTFFEHLEALRWHLVRSVTAIFVIAVAVFIFKDFVFDAIIYAPKYESFPTYRFLCGLSETICLVPKDFIIQSFKIEELFVTAIKASFVIGFLVAFPYIFYEIWSFVKPGLYDSEVKAAKGMVFNCSVLFITGVLFGYYVITPFALAFLTNFTLGDTMVQPTMSSYINNLIMYTLPTGLVFELPVVIYILSKAGIVSSGFLKKQRRIAFVVIIVLAAIITPPDVMTQFFIGMPLYLLYEFGIVIAKRVEKRKTQEEKNVTKTDI